MKRMAKPFLYALLYIGLSLGTEVALLASGLRIPRDNRMVAPVVLTLPPLLAAWLGGYRRTRTFLTAAS